MHSAKQMAFRDLQIMANWEHVAPEKGRGLTKGMVGNPCLPGEPLKPTLILSSGEWDKPTC